MTHVGWAAFRQVQFNVHDVRRSDEGCREVPGFSRVTTYAPDVVYRVILLHQIGVVLDVNRHVAPEAGEAFTGRRSGLDHVALGVADPDALKLFSPPPRRPL